MDNKGLAIVTGGASGLGRAMAQNLLGKGWKVAVCDINEEGLSTLDQQILAYTLDVTDDVAVHEAIEKIVRDHGEISVLVNCAGVIHSEPLINMMNPDQMRHSLGSFKRVIDLDLTSVFIMGSVVAEQMVLKRTKGLIINISSIAGLGNAGQTAYSASKGGVNSMTKAWAKELGVFGIRCVAIAPGFVDTPSTHAALNEKIIEHVTENTPLRKLGKTENIVSAVNYAIENDFLTGTILEVDGGLTI